jgi:hypothetical protein
MIALTRFTASALMRKKMVATRWYNVKERKELWHKQM